MGLRDNEAQVFAEAVQVSAGKVLRVSTMLTNMVRDNRANLGIGINHADQWDPKGLPSQQH
eukprot:8173927-Lingulodinium_polyedra.AAC.1